MVAKKNKHKISLTARIILIVLPVSLILVGIFSYWFYFLRPALYFENMRNKLTDLNSVSYEGSVLLKGNIDSSEINTKLNFSGLLNSEDEESYLKIRPSGFFDSLLVDSEFEILSDPKNYYLKINTLPQILKLYLGEVNLENRWVQIAKAEENEREISLEKIDFGKISYYKSDHLDNQKTLVVKAEITSNNFDEVFSQDSIKTVFTEAEINSILESLKKTDIYHCYFWVDGDYQLRKLNLNLPIDFQGQKLEADISISFKNHNVLKEIIFPDIYEKADDVFGALERK